MDVFAFLVVAGAMVALYTSLRRVRERNDDNSARLTDLVHEIEAVRKAFHRRVTELEAQVAYLRGTKPSEAPAPALAAEAPAAAIGEPQFPVAEIPAAALPGQPPEGVMPEALGEPGVAAPETPAGAPVGEVPGAPPFEPPSAEPPSPPFQPLPPAPWERIDWEQWIGVRGAALLGGVVLALAAVLFLQYSIEHGLIPPIVRVAIGFLVGAGAIAGSEALRKRGYSTTANALAGAGVVILYASVWAARTLYELIGTGLAFALMIFVTVACGLLSWRHAAREIAVLGLVGGFLTPILLSSGSDNPIGLFAYVLMLDCGLLVLARKRRWPILMGLGLLATLFYQFVWILGRMGPDRLWLGLLVLGVFSAFFSLAGNWRSEDGEGSSPQPALPRMTQIAGVLLPFIFALYFASQANLGPHLYPTAILMAVLCAAACWLGRVQRFALLPIGAASGSLGVVLVWSIATALQPALEWEALGICLGLVIIFHVFVELALLAPQEQTEEIARIAFRPAWIAALGFLMLFAVRPAVEGHPSPWPWVCGWLALAALLVRQSALPGRGRTQVIAAAGMALGFGLYLVSQQGTRSLPPAAVFLGLALLACAAFQGLAFRWTDAGARRLADIAAATAPMILLLFQVLIAKDPEFDARLFLAVTLLLALLTILAVTRLGVGLAYFGCMFVLAFCHLIWTSEATGLDQNTGVAVAAMGLQVFAVLLLTFWPFLAGPRFLSSRWTIYGAALAGPAWFLSLRELYEVQFGESTIGLLPVALGALSLAAVQRARKMAVFDEPAPRALVWFSAVALSFIALAIPLQLDKEWITIGWAVQGFAIIALWKRLDHPGLKYFGLALLGAATVRLLLNAEVLDYHPRSGLPIVNWLMYTYLLPAAALLVSARVLRDLEIARVRAWEAVLYEHRKPAGALACGMGVILLVFAWINLAIFDFFSTGTRVEISFERMAARDLTLSLAWAVYALVLLGIGFQRDTGGLRWVSLAFLVLTIGKVFLHDLGELEDLYRVASLVGLALSLILVSLAYQRFVFRKGSTEGKR